MLINNTAELKSYLPTSVALDFNDIKPKIRLVERETIKRIFSKAIYDTVIVGGDSADIQELREVLEEATAHLALLHYIGFGQTQISSGGIQIQIEDNLKPAFEWQINELKNECSKQGWDAIEAALELLENTSDENLSALWQSTPTYLHSTKSLISNLRTFEKFVSLNHSRVLFNKLIPILTDQQEEVILPAVGDALFAKILSYDSETNQEKKAILSKTFKLASKSLAYHTAAIGFMDSLLILSDNGPMVMDGLGTSVSNAKKTAPTELVAIISENYKTRAAAAMRELIQYCQANVDTIPEYISSANYISNEDQSEHIPRNDPDWGIAFF